MILLKAYHTDKYALNFQNSVALESVQSPVVDFTNFLMHRKHIVDLN